MIIKVSLSVCYPELSGQSNGNKFLCSGLAICTGNSYNGYFKFFYGGS